MTPLTSVDLASVWPQQFTPSPLLPPGPEMALHLPYTYSTLGAAIKASLEAMLWTVRAATTPLCCQYCSKVEFTIIVVRTKCRWFPTHSQVGVSVQHPRGKGSIWLGGVRVGFKCSLVRGNKRRCAWMALGISPPPSVALLLLSGFTTPTLGGGSDGLATRPPAAEKPHRAKNSIQTLLFHDSILCRQLFSGIPSQWKATEKNA